MRSPALKGLEGQGKKWKAIAIVWFLCGLACECAAALFFLSADEPVSLFGFHGAALLFLAGAFIAAKKIISPHAGLIPLLTFSLVLTALLPVAGFMTALLCLFCYGVFRRRLKQGIYEDYEAFLFEKQQQGEVKGRFIGDLRRLRESVSFEPFVDIVQSGSAALKTKVIAKLSESLSAQNVQLLKKALKDPAAEIRLYAATALLKVEKQLNSEIKKAISGAQHEGSAASYAELGRLYYLYASVDLVDENLAEHYLKQAAKAYEESLDLETDQRETVLEYAKVLLELGQTDRARRLLQRAVTLWPGDRSVVMLKNKMDFDARQFEMLKPALLGSHLEGLSPDEKLAADFWLEAGPHE